MPNYRLFAVAAAVVAGAFSAEPARGAENPSPGGGQHANSPAPGQAPATPANNAPPGAPANGGQSSHASGTHHGTEHARENGPDRRRRIVYVPNYGYTYWAGDYSNPYWSTPGNWYVNEGNPPTQPPAPNRDVTVTPAASSRPQEEAAIAEMTTARARLARQFETSEEVRASLHDLQDAQRAFDVAVAEANRRLQQDPEYRKAQALKDQAATRVEAARTAELPPVTSPSATQPAPISPEVVSAAQQKLKAASEVTTIATRDAQQDPVVNDARQKLEAAADRLNALKAGFDASLQADPQWLAAKQKLDAAKVPAPSR